MKKTLLTALCLSGMVAAQAQNGQVDRSNDYKGYQKTHTVDDNAQPVGQLEPSYLFGPDRTTPFWTEDFSGGSIPAGWSNVDEQTPVGTPNVTFQWSDDPTAVPALGYTASEEFMAAGASTGYLYADSDRGLAAAPGFDHLTKLTTTAIDCSNEPTVLFTMQSLIGVFDYDANTNVKIRVSNDSINWTDFIPYPCLVTGAAAPPCDRWSANPQGVALDITSVAGNQATVYIQFEWLGGWEYFWAIDDLALSPIPDYERILDFAYLSHYGFGLEYGRVPRGQLMSDFILGGQLRNFGGQAQTNVVMTCDVVGPLGTSVFSASETFATLNPGDTVVMEQLATLPSMLDEGIYTATLSVSSDQNGLETDLTNDTIVRTFALEDFLYSLDGIDVHGGMTTLSSIGTASFLNSSDGVFCLTNYPITQQTTVYAMDVLITAGSVPGALISASIHDSLAVIDNDDISSPIYSTTEYTLTQDDVNNGFVRIVFDSPQTLAPGPYYAGVELFSNGNTNDISVIDDVTVPQPALASVINLQTVTPPGTFTNGNAMAIRFVLDPSVGIGEADEVPGMSVFPNPTLDGQVRVTTEGAETFDLQVTNTLGEVVRTGRFTGSTIIDLSGEAAGVYTVRVSDGARSSVRLVARH